MAYWRGPETTIMNGLFFLLDFRIYDYEGRSFLWTNTGVHSVVTDGVHSPSLCACPLPFFFLLLRSRLAGLSCLITILRQADIYIYSFWEPVGGDEKELDYLISI